MSGLSLWLALALAPLPLPEQPTVIVVQGADGTPEYGEQFRLWSSRWEQSARQGQARFILVGQSVDTSTTDRDQLRQVISSECSGGSPLWLVLIGHGTFDYRSAKLNLRGPDVTAGELAEWVQPCTRPLAVINCTSSSAPFLTELAGDNRVIVTATRSGVEQNLTRFGDAISAVIASPAADLDKDGQTSLLEAWLVADRHTQESYQQEGRLATEHSLLDDNGDGKGTPAEWFQGIRATRKPQGTELVDGYRAHQFQLVRSEQEQQLNTVQVRERNRLELEIHQLRSRKTSFASEEDYFRELERLLRELAGIYGLTE